MKYFLVLSNDNSEPGRSFSINEHMISIHGTSIENAAPESV